MASRTPVGVLVKLPLLFTLLAGIPLVVLSWLGWRLLQDDRALENSRLRDELDGAATLLAHEVDRNLTGWEDTLAAVGQQRPVDVPRDIAVLVVSADGVRQHQGAALPYYPRLPTPPELPATVFAGAEVREFREHDLAGAATMYRAIARTTSPDIRAAALTRLARCLRKQDLTSDALVVYLELAAMGDTPTAAGPANLVARRERIGLFDQAGARAASAREAKLLASLLSPGQAAMDHATFDYYSESLPWRPVDNPSTTLAQAAEDLWPRLQHEQAGRAAWSRGARAAVVVWRPAGTGTAVMIGTIDSLMARSVTVLQNLHVAAALDDDAGRPVWMSASLPAQSPLAIARSSRDTGLPWALRVVPINVADADRVAASRRRFFGASLGMIVLVLAGASYVAYRSVNRELGTARLQSEFVSAVSHEFRTPLTAMRHLTDMLEEGGARQDRLPAYYQALGKETRRLHAMVENLLDFGRMEAGRRRYDMAATDAIALTKQVVDDFRQPSSLNSHHLELKTGNDPVTIRVDRQAFALALWNLLDNAVKYSPEASRVTVAIRRSGTLAGISVTDRGAGIPKHEQRDVFRKFVRGSAATKLSVKGTGLGLAMVDRIVKAHDGHVELRSQAGAGSTFTIWLPDASEPRNLGTTEPTSRGT